jgi:hypothetical protein
VLKKAREKLRKYRQNLEPHHSLILLTPTAAHSAGPALSPVL